MAIFENNPTLFYSVVGGIVVLIIILIWLLVRKPKGESKKHKGEYEYYGVDKTIRSKRRYILLNIVDTDKASVKKLPASTVLFTATINLSKLAKGNKKLSATITKALNEKVVIDRFPTYLLLEILPKDVNDFDVQPNLKNEYIQNLKNLVFYSTNVEDLKNFMEER